MYNKGDRILVSGDLAAPETLKKYTVTRTVKEGSEQVVYVEEGGGPFYGGFTWPERVYEELLGVMKERQKLKKAYDDSMALVYQLRNALSRGEK